MSGKRYFDPAQAESEHKDLVISQLKAEIHDLRQNSKDYNELNDHLNNLQHKYTLLQEEKLLSERDRRDRSENDQQMLQNYKEDFDMLQSDIRKQNIDLQELRGDNKALKEMADFRTQEIIHLRAELQSIELDENRSQEEIQQIKNSLRILQKDKTDLLTDLDKSNLQTDQQSLKLKNLEKSVQNLRLDANQSESNLLQLEQFNDRLRSILKDKRDIQGDSDLQMRQNEERLKSLTQQYQDLDSQNKQVYLQSQKEQDKYQEQINIGKENSQNLNNVETTVRSKELHIDDLRNNYDVLKQKHFQLVDESKTQNEQMDLILSQIEQLNAKNKDLLQQLDIFQEQDEKVRSILDRKEQSQQLVEEMDLQLKESVAPILHLTRQG